MLPNYQQVIMICVGFIFLYLAIAKKVESQLFLPLGFCTILVNIPLAEMTGANGIIGVLFNNAISSCEILPLILFLGIGTMLDFSSLIHRPSFFVLGFICQMGIFAATGFALLMGFSLNDAFSAGIIGAADGPTAILVGTYSKTQYIAAVTIASYSYMALVPVIQPIVIRFLTTKKERQIVNQRMEGSVSRRKLILFPVIITLISALIAPKTLALVGFLMLGNLIKESGVMGNATKTFQTALVDIATVLLAIALSFNMQAKNFFDMKTIMILIIGLSAFVMDMVFGIVFVKLCNLVSKNKLNPLVGSAGISAFPIASRVAQQCATSASPGNIILNETIAANAAGQLASAVVGGLIMSFFM